MNTTMLGPCIGHTTSTSTKIWIYSDSVQELSCIIRNHEIVIKKPFLKLRENVNAFVVTIENLRPFTKYTYEIVDYKNEKVNLEGLSSSDLFFTTMPNEDSDLERFDFLLMSCNDPLGASKNKSYKNRAYALWDNLPSILEESTKGSDKKVLIGILGGDQLYCDDIANDVFRSKDPVERLQLYIQNYKRYWNNLSYRKALCSLPCYLMWDDHDIIDGWGSREDSFDKNNDFLPKWKNLFGSAKEAFEIMQASRNPASLTRDGFDFGIRIGPVGIVGADLRSNRNSHKGEMWTKNQFEAFKKWVKENQSEIEVLFFVSPVVFAHGAEIIDEGFIIKRWGCITDFFKFFQKKNPYLFSLASLFLSIALGFLSICLAIILFLLLMLTKFWMTPVFFNTLGDLRDDINDSWGADVNARIAEEFLDYAFALQNEADKEKRIHFVILTGDIHTAGYSMIYSNEVAHATRPVIPHIVSSPVAYVPFPWIGEAFYRKFTIGDAFIGSNKKYQAQISHHFTERNVVVCSLRRKQDDSKSFALKVKYYLEGMPEPQIALFDLDKSSHREKISW